MRKIALNLFIEHSGEHWCEQNIFCSFTTSQAFWQRSAPGALSTLVTVVLYLLTWATLMSPGKDETRVCGYIYALNLFIEHSGEHWWEQYIFCSFTTPQAFWQSSAPGALSTLVTIVVLYSLTRATLISPGKDETRVCGYIYIYIGSFYTFCLHLFYRSILRLFLLPNVFLLLIVLYPLIVLYRLDTLS